MSEKPCAAFEWICQVLYSCDGCGNPFWTHTHESRVRDKGRRFHKSISREFAERIRANWEPAMIADNYTPPMDREASDA